MAGILTPNLLMNVAGFALQNKNCAIYEGTEELFTGMIGNIIFGPAIMDATVSQDSRLTRNPVESGVVVADHKIKMPPVIVIQMAMPRWFFESHIAKLEQLYNDSTYLNIMTKTDFYTDMVLTARPYNLSNRNQDRPVIKCRFEKVVRIVPEYLSVKLTEAKKDSNNVDAGKQQPVNITPKIFPVA